MLLSVLCALLSDGLAAAWGKTTNAHRLRLQRIRRAITGFLVACWKIIRVWATLHVLTILALVRGATSGGRRGVFSREFDKWQVSVTTRPSGRQDGNCYSRLTLPACAPKEVACESAKSHMGLYHSHPLGSVGQGPAPGLLLRLVQSQLGRGGA